MSEKTYVIQDAAMSTRFARVVEAFAEKERYCIGSDILYREDVVKLLQREHAAVRRKVRAMETIAQHITAQRGDELISRKDLLAWLDERGR